MRALRHPPYAVGLGVCGGLSLSLAVRAPSLFMLVGAGLLVAAAASARDGRVRAAAVVAAMAVVALWWGSVRLDVLDDSTLAAHAGQAAPATVVVTAPARRTLFDVRVPVHVRRYGRIAVDEPALLKLPLGRAPPQGAVLELIASIRAPRSGDGRGFDERRWLARRGVHVVLRTAAWRQVGRRGGIGGLADRTRARLESTVAVGLSGERRALIGGIVLGTDEHLPDDLQDAFRASGLYHLLAVSGQNVAIVAGGVLLLSWLLGIGRLRGEVLALAAIGGYVLAVGAQPSVVRAGVAGALASLAWIAGRDRDRWHFLLVGAAVLLGWNPYNLLEPGFQLSFVAVAAIFVFVPRLTRRLEGYPLPARAAALVAVASACGVATAPVLWLHFGEVPLYSVVSNALAEPAVAPVLALAFAAAILEPVAPGAASILAWLNGWVVAYIAWCARVVASFPHASTTSAWVLVAIGALLALCVLIARLPRYLRPRAIALAAAAAVLLTGWELVPADSPPPPRGLRVTFLDVGQGDAVLLQVPEGAVLVDQGPPEGEVARQLRDLGVRRLAALVLTHPQRDHIGGAADVLRSVRVDLVLDPRIPAESPHHDDALDAARDRRVRVGVAAAGQRYDLGRLHLRLLWPRQPVPPGRNPNDHATVIVASYGATDLVLTADAESNVTLPLRLPPAEVLKVAHHGSADDGLPALLERVRPQVAVVSVGRNNDYGHPAPSTVSALAGARNLDVYRTDLDGRVTVESDGRRLTVRAARCSRLCPWRS